MKKSSVAKKQSAVSSRKRSPRKANIDVIPSKPVSKAENAPSSSQQETKVGLQSTISVSPVAGILLEDRCRQLVELVRMRTDYVRAQGNLDRQIKAMIRRLTNKKKVSTADIAEYMANAPIGIRAHLQRFITLRNEARVYRKEYDALCTRNAEQLPVYSTFVEPINGMGAIGLALIVGEAGGDLNNYSNPAKLWKRFGLAPLNGKAGSVWMRRGGLSDEQWSQFGYSPRRRSTMFVVTDSLLKKENTYKVLCDARKQLERAKAEAEGLQVAAAADIPKKEAAKYRSLIHIKLRAERYVAKRLLRDLWRAWRGQHLLDIHSTCASSPSKDAA
jgi:hypothetical protein